MITPTPKVSNNQDLSLDDIFIRSRSTQSYDDIIIQRFKNSNERYDVNDSSRSFDQNLISNKTCPERFELDLEKNLVTREF